MTGDEFVAYADDPLVIVKDGKTLFAIRADGTVEGEKVDMNEAAKIFADCLMEEMAKRRSPLCCAGGPQRRHALSCPTLP